MSTAKDLEARIEALEQRLKALEDGPRLVADSIAQGHCCTDYNCPVCGPGSDPLPRAEQVKSVCSECGYTFNGYCVARCPECGELSINWIYTTPSAYSLVSSEDTGSNDFCGGGLLSRMELLTLDPDSSLGTPFGLGLPRGAPWSCIGSPLGVPYGSVSALFGPTTKEE